MILITSFKPWGLVRENVTETIVKRLKQERRELKLEELKQVKFITLPADKEGIDAFSSYLKFESPDIIIHLGHIPMSKDFRIESSAYSKGKTKISSDLARYIGLRLGIKLTDKIGKGFCNDLYHLSLDNGYTSMFIHIGPNYGTDEALIKILRIIKVCKEVKLKNVNE